MEVLAKLGRWLGITHSKRVQLYTQREEVRPPVKKLAPRRDVEMFRDAQGEIRHVRIGSWRVIAASCTRRIAEVRQLAACSRLAVRIELKETGSLFPTCTIWELYDVKGILLAMLQTTRDQEFWLATDFQTGRVWRSGEPAAVGIPA